MRNFNLTLPEGQPWGIDRIQTYFLQQIAMSMENERRESVFWKKQAEDAEQENRVIKLALALMVNRQEVTEFFELDTMRLSKLRDLLYSQRGIAAWYLDNENLREAIYHTDYLDVEKSGRGFNVRVIR